MKCLCKVSSPYLNWKYIRPLSPYNCAVLFTAMCQKLWMERKFSLFIRCSRGILSTGSWPTMLSSGDLTIPGCLLGAVDGCRMLEGHQVRSFDQNFWSAICADAGFCFVDYHNTVIYRRYCSQVALCTLME